MSRSELLTVLTLHGDEGEPDHGALAEAWSAFLASSTGGCLFHELGFLAYHPADRFQFRNLLVARGGTTMALVPGGITKRDGRTVFRSPLGASFGGPVLPGRLSAADTLAVLESLKDHAVREGWAGIALVPPPSIYRGDGSGTLDFCLRASGFRLESRMLCHAIHLPHTDDGEPFALLFRGKNARRAKAALKEGVETQIGGVELLSPFQAVFDETYGRHGVPPTHSLPEIRDLFERMPARFAIAVSLWNKIPLSGLFIMKMSKRVANAFYICSGGGHPELNAGLVTFASVLNHQAREGRVILDLGPSSDDQGVIDSGVAYFKESLGAIGYCRDHWHWSAA